MCLRKSRFVQQHERKARKFPDQRLVMGDSMRPSTFSVFTRTPISPLYLSSLVSYLRKTSFPGFKPCDVAKFTVMHDILALCSGVKGVHADMLS